MGYDVSVLRNTRELEDFIPEWREFLATRVCGHTFDNDPTIISLALAGDTQLSLRIIIVREHGKIQGIAPCYIQPTRFKIEVSVLPLVSIPARFLKIFGNDLIYSQDVDKGNVTGAVFEVLDRFRTEFDLGFFESIDVAGDLWGHCERAFPGQGNFQCIIPSSSYEKAHRISINSSHDEYMKTLGSNTRQTLRRNARRLLNEHRAELVRVTTPEQVRPFLARLDKVYQDSWQAKTFGFHRQNTDAQAARLERIAELGWLRSYLLQIGDTPISFQVGYVYNKVFYARNFAFAHSHASLSPGSVLMNIFIKELFQERGLDAIELGYGDMPHKKSFRGTPSDVGTAYIIHTMSWRQILGLQKRLSGFEEMARSTLTKIRLDRTVRRVLKHKR